MNKICAGCSKTVYAVEELRTSDQSWHKGCFRCTSCNLQLNLKNFKVHEKRPYCHTHYPTQRSFTVVSDTPENQRVHKNQDIVSQASYQGLREKKARGEEVRGMGDFEPTGPQNPSLARQPAASAARAPPVSYDQGPPFQAQMGYPPQQYSSPDPDPVAAAPPSSSGMGQRPVGGVRLLPGPSQQPAAAPATYNQPTQPASYNNPPPEQPQAAPVRLPYASAVPPQQVFNSTPSNQMQYSQAQSQTYNQAVGRSSVGQVTPYNMPSAPAPAPAVPQGPVYRAMYAYTAGDTDEVSFDEGDLIVNTSVASEGWMIGTVQKTGQHGLLPSNYVEQR